MIKHPRAFATLVTLVFVGVVWIGHDKYFGLSLKLDLDVVALATLAVGVIIAFSLQNYVQAKASDERVEKDFLIGNLRELVGTLRTIREHATEIIESGAVKPSQRKVILSLFRRCANDLLIIETALEMSKCKGLKVHCTAVQTALFGYKGSVTDSGFSTQGYKAQTLGFQERMFSKLTAEIHQLLFRINTY